MHQKPPRYIVFSTVPEYGSSNYSYIMFCRNVKFLMHNTCLLEILAVVLCCVKFPVYFVSESLYFHPQISPRFGAECCSLGEQDKFESQKRFAVAC